MLGWIKHGSCAESEKGRSMNPLPAQKIKFGVRVKDDEIVGEKQWFEAGKGVDGGGS
jgi:hypothetical protein